MCGIVGGWWVAAPLDLERRASDSLQAMHNRGPNERGSQLATISGGVLFLGHTRLSIIDLTPSGHQPMSSRDGRFTITYNGEIYNYLELKNELRDLGHTFVSESDTEVLLQAWCEWGASCLPRLIGMFAFAIYDHFKNELTCARDAFGIKPLFYTTTPHHFVFASEQRPLLILTGEKPRPDWQRCYDYLVHGETDSQQCTFLDGIHHLLPAHWVTFNLATQTLGVQQRWWTPSTSETTTLPFRETADIIREYFLRSVRLHMRSDVPLGAALSGGIDSSALVCAMRYLEPNRDIKTFSFIDRGYSRSEEPWVDQVNNHVNAIPHKLLLTGSEFARDLDELIRIQGEPFGTPAVYGQYRIFKLAKESGITVTLDGQGADELFAGYVGYPGYRVLSLLETGHPLEAFRFAYHWSLWPYRSYLQPWQQIANELAARARAFPPHNCTVWSEPKWINSTFVREMGVCSTHIRVSLPKVLRGRRVTGAQCDALTRTGIPHLLRHADRTSMCSSVESRVPFLTLPMADFALSLPEHFLISPQGETKHVLREAMRGIVPDSLLNRRDKIGFGTPDERWLIETAPLTKEWLRSCGHIPLFNHKELLKCFEGIVSGNLPYTWRAWCWIIFLKWFQQLGFEL